MFVSPLLLQVLLVGQAQVDILDLAVLARPNLPGQGHQAGMGQLGKVPGGWG